MKDSRALSRSFCAVTGVITIFVLTVLDQGSKLWALWALKNKASIPIISGVLELKYLENRGMAFGLLQGKVPILILLCLLFFCVFFYGYLRIPKNQWFFPLLMVLYVLVSGALGNLFDRIFRGYVVDYIYFSLIDFPIFNMADIYVVCGGILLVLFVCFKYKDEDFAFLNPHYKG